MSDTPSTSVVTLRDLPIAARLVLATFLISVGVGYFSALVQLHFQQASPGQLMPEADDAVRAYSGDQKRPMSKIEALLEAPAELPFNGAGQMRTAFTKKSGGWEGKLKKLKPEEQQKLEAEREGERLALLEWIRAGADKESFDKGEDGDFVLPDSLAQQPVSEEYLVKEGGKSHVKIKSLFVDRCTSCHTKEDGGRDKKAAKFPLDTVEQIRPYAQVKEGAGGMSLSKLAQTTHVHLLGFSMLYGLTGLIFAFTSWPIPVRCVIGPLALIAQVIDISCWWLARLDPYYARMIVFTGGAVAVSLGAQILGSLFNLFDKMGKAVLVVMIVAALALGGVVKVKVIDPQLAREKVEAGIVKPEAAP